jgi:lysophospholipase L1-like esterase
MRSLPCLLALALFATPAAAQRAEDRHGLPELTVKDLAAKYLMQQADLADLKFYRDQNRVVIASKDPRPRIVLMGDSITFHWEAEERPAPAALNLLNRGIAGQNSDQMLMRFEDDVVALKPAAVVIAAGANDARVYVGAPADAREQVVARIARNVSAMADIAEGRRIKVVIAAITPCRGCAALGRDPGTIVAANTWLRQFASERGYPFVDYHAAIVGPDGQLPAQLTRDGLHPLPPGYALMWKKLAPALAALKLIL